MIDRQFNQGKTSADFAINNKKQEKPSTILINFNKYIDLDASVYKNTNNLTTFTQKHNLPIYTTPIQYLNLNPKQLNQSHKTTIKPVSLNISLKNLSNSSQQIKHKQDELVLMTNLKMRAAKQPYEQVNAYSKKRLQEKINQAELKMAELGFSFNHRREEKKTILQNNQPITNS